jgi:hypothetical protein
MRCGRIGRKLMAYHDGELAASDRTAVEEHLLACAACRETLGTLREADRAATPMPGPAYWDGFTARVMAALPDQAPVTARPLRFHPPRPAWLHFAPAALAATLLLVAGGYFLDIDVSLRRRSPETAAPETAMKSRAAVAIPRDEDAEAVSDGLAVYPAAPAAAGLPMRDLLRRNLAGGELLLVQILNIKPNGDRYELKALKSDLSGSGLLERSTMLRDAISPAGDPELVSLMDDLVEAMRRLQGASPGDLPDVQSEIRRSGVLERAAAYKVLLAEGGDRL